MVKFFPVDPGHLREELTRYSTCFITFLPHSSVFLQCVNSLSLSTAACLWAAVILSILSIMLYRTKPENIFSWSSLFKSPLEGSAVLQGCNLFTAKRFNSWAQSLTAQSSSCLNLCSERTTLVLFFKMTLLALTILEKALQTETKNKTKTVLPQNISPKRDKCPPKQKRMLILKSTNEHFNGRDVLVMVVPSCSLLQGLHAPPVSLWMCIPWVETWEQAWPSWLSLAPSSP